LWQRISNDRVVLVDHAESDSAIRIHMSIGQRLPLMIAALGRCMAAHSGLPRAELARIFAGLRWQDAPTFETYMAQVEEAGRRGYAIDDGHYVKGVTTVSAAILGPDGRPSNAISAVGFTAQFTGDALDRLALEVRDIAREVTRGLSGADQEPSR
jgi:DNA-binding IclR family transcriptional regulator